VGEEFQADFSVLAGAGPVPGEVYAPYDKGGEITVKVSPGTGTAFDFPDTSVVPAGPFTLDTRSKAVLENVPLTGAPITLSCAGEGGACGDAGVTIVRASTTDGDTTGLSPFAMPAPKRLQVDLSCVVFGGAGVVTVPAEAMEFLRQAHAKSPITRIRTAFMRDGAAIATNPAPQPPNAVSIVVGRGVLGFTNPARVPSP
jgi:hypothetical protein